MKTINDYLGDETVKVSNPKFKEVEVKHFIGKRLITLCQITAKMNNPLIEGIFYISSIGVSIRNPEDDDSELGRTIAEGRAIKNPIRAISLVSNKKLPKPIIEEQLIWAEKNVERHLGDYVNNLRETLKYE